jgi:predicted small metal-binding protein
VAEFSCAAAGADSCGWSTSGEDEDELVAEVAEHLRTKHDVQVVSGTLAKYALAVARGEDVAPAGD